MITATPVLASGLSTAKHLHFQVSCRGKQHTVVFDRGKSRFRLPNHTREEVERELALEELGGEACPCVQARSAWSQNLMPGDSWDAPPLHSALQGAASACMAKRCKRQTDARIDELTISPFRERPSFVEKRIQHIVAQLWPSLDMKVHVRSRLCPPEYHALYLVKPGFSGREFHLIKKTWFSDVRRHQLGRWCECGCWEDSLVVGAEPYQSDSGPMGDLLTLCRPQVDSTNGHLYFINEKVGLVEKQVDFRTSVS